MKMAVLDLTLKNAGANNVEMDIYEFYVKKLSPFASAEVLVTTQATETPAISGGYSALSMYQIGTTPFEFQNMGRYLTITKKTKVMISPGNAYTYQIRDGSKKNLPTDRITDQTSQTFGFPGWTKGIFVVTKGTPAPNQGSAGLTTRAELTTVSGSVTRSYSWRNVDRYAFDRAGYTGFATG